MNHAPSTVSILICTGRQPGDLEGTFESLRLTELPADTIGELVVVDNSQGGDTYQALRKQTPPVPHLSFCVLHEPRRGKVHALHAGIAAARGDVLLFTDDDVRVPPSWIVAMVRPILVGTADAVAGGIHLAPALQRPWMEPFHRAWMASTEALSPAQPEALIGANMALARRVFERVPRFDPELGPGSALGSGEESLYSFQLRAAGFRIVSVFDTSVEHDFDPSRLSRRSFLNRAKIEGKVSAYIAYHWEHTPLPVPYRQWLGEWVRLQAKRWLRLWRTSPEGAPAWELHHLIRLHFIRQYLRERRRPPLYPKHGFIKAGDAGDAASPSHREIPSENCRLA